MTDSQEGLDSASASGGVNEPAERSGARANMPVRAYRLGEEPGDDLSAVTTADERFAMVWELSARMWALTGKPMVTYARSELPVKVIRRGVCEFDSSLGMQSRIARVTD